MFRHIVAMRLKYYFREKSIVFWLIAFPVILATLFNLALTGILNGETLQKIDVVLVIEGATTMDVEPPSAIETALASIEHFEISYSSEAEAKQSLDHGDISGIIYIKNEVAADGVTLVPTVLLEISENGMNQTILKETIDIINQKINLNMYIYATGNVPADTFAEAKTYVRDAFEENNPPNTVVTFFYTVLAMACAYGAMTGVDATHHIQANLSPQGIRQGVTPVSKMKQVLATFTASAIAQCLSMSVVLFYIAVVLGIDFGNRIGLILVTTYVGAISHLAIGLGIGAIFKFSQNVKISIIIGVSMLGSFLAGMMSTNVRYSVYVHAPIVNYLNPVNLVSDSYSKLYYYVGLKEYAVNISILLAMGILSFVIAICSLRRQKYDSI